MPRQPLLLKLTTLGCEDSSEDKALAAKARALVENVC